MLAKLRTFNLKMKSNSETIQLEATNRHELLGATNSEDWKIGQSRIRRDSGARIAMDRALNKRAAHSAVGIMRSSADPHGCVDGPREPLPRGEHNVLVPASDSHPAAAAMEEPPQENTLGSRLRRRTQEYAMRFDSERAAKGRKGDSPSHA